MHSKGALACPLVFSVSKEKAKVCERTNRRKMNSVEERKFKKIVTMSSYLGRSLDHGKLCCRLRVIESVISCADHTAW